MCMSLYRQTQTETFRAKLVMSEKVLCDTNDLRNLLTLVDLKEEFTGIKVLSSCTHLHVVSILNYLLSSTECNR